MRAPANYYGGKGYMFRKIIALFPPHQTYVEPFGGMAWVLLNKEPSPVEVYNDIDGELVNLFQVIREQGSKLRQLLQLTPYAREEFVSCLSIDDGDGSLERARKTFVRLRQGFFSKGDSPGRWGYSISLSRRGMAATTSNYLSSIDDNLPLVWERLRRVQLENKDALNVLQRYDTSETLFYCDPPYPAGVRVDVRSFTHEMSDEQHHELLGTLCELKGMVILSGYRCPLYDETLRDWVSREFNAVAWSSGKCRTRGGKGSRAPNRTEVVWLNPATVVRQENLAAEQLKFLKGVHP